MFNCLFYEINVDFDSPGEFSINPVPKNCGTCFHWNEEKEKCDDEEKVKGE